jgi:hypothetical protein
LTTYFGNQISEYEDSSYYGYLEWFFNTIACPGSGSQIVKELSMLSYGDGATALRMGLYDSGGNLICQGSGPFYPTGDSLTWQGHLTQSNITPNPCTLTGGAQYNLAFSNTSYGDFHYSYSLPGGNQRYSCSGDYTGGMPDSLPSGTASANFDCMRCGVDPAAGGLSIPVAIRTYRNLRN